MEYEDGPWALVARGAVCGALAWLAVFLVTWLSVVGPTRAGSPAIVAALVLDAHYPLAPGAVTTLDPLTWFELPAATLYLLAPTLIATGGVAAGRLTKTARLRTGTVAGATVTLGYGPLLALLAVLLDAGGELLVVATAVSLISAILGGVVGVRT
jgi:hypothetical protein